MKKYFVIAFLLCVPLLCAQQRYINVDGTSEIEVNADQVKFNVQVKVIDKTLPDAKKKDDEYLNQLLQILKGQDILTDDIEVSPITLGKNYEYTDRERVQRGFYALVNVSFLLKDLSKYYDLTDNLTKNESFEITGASYDISDYEKQNKKAYEEALNAAKQKAEYMCSTLGVSAGDVLEIDETGNSPGYPTPFNVRTKEGGQPENPFGNVTIRKTVRVKFEIK